MDKKLLNKILPYCGHGLKSIYKDYCVESLKNNPYAE